jgi:hypothetical protein
MQRTDVTRPRELLHAPTLQEMLEMDSEIDGGRCPCRDGAALCCLLIVKREGEGGQVTVGSRGRSFTLYRSADQCRSEHRRATVQ